MAAKKKAKLWKVQIVAAAENYTSKAKARKTAKKVFGLMDSERVIYEEVEE